MNPETSETPQVETPALPSAADLRAKADAALANLEQHLTELYNSIEPISGNVHIGGVRSLLEQFLAMVKHTKIAL